MEKGNEGLIRERIRVNSKAMTAIVVEDEVALRRAIVRMLTRSGFTVVDFGDPLEAISEVGLMSTPPDLLLTDMVLPYMSGRELASRLGLPTIVMSGYQVVVDTKGSGPSQHFLEKPFTTVDLLEAVGNLLGDRRAVATGSV